MAAKRLTPSLDASPNRRPRRTDEPPAELQPWSGTHRRATSRRSTCAARDGGVHRVAPLARVESGHSPRRAAHASDHTRCALIAMTFHGPSAACAANDGLVLADGTQLLFRPLRTDDRVGLAALFARLTPESRYRRSLSPKRELLPRELTHLTDIDHLDHEAVAAIARRVHAHRSTGSVIELELELGRRPLNPARNFAPPAR